MKAWSNLTQLKKINSGKLAKTSVAVLLLFSLSFYFTRGAAALTVDWQASTATGSGTITGENNVLAADGSKATLTFNTLPSVTVSGFSGTPPGGATYSTVDSVVLRWVTDSSLSSGSSGNDEIYLEYSVNGGSTWSSTGSTYTTSALPGTQEVTLTTKDGSNAWTWADLANIQMRIRTTKLNASDNCSWGVDALYLTVNYTLDATPPTTNMSAPADASNVKGTVNLQATSTDNMHTAQVDFEYADNSSFTGATILSGATLTSGTNKSGTWSLSWNTSSLNGTYYVRAKGIDGNGNSAYSGYFTYVIDNTVPSTATMSSPANLADIKGSISLTANAQDNINVSTVDFQWADNTSFTSATTVSGATLTSGDVTNGTWTKTGFDTSTMGDGTRYIRARVTDAHGNVTTGAYITVSADNTAPSVATVTAPAADTYVSGSINLEANAQDAISVNSVDFEYADNTSFTGSTTLSGATLVSGTNQNGTWRYSGLDTTTFTDGNYYFRAIVTDKSGNTTVGSYITLKVDNYAPTISSISVVNDTTVDLQYSEVVSAATTENLANYSFSPTLTKVSATLQGDGKTVRLVTSTQTKGTSYTVTVNDVKDLAANTIAVNSTTTFTGVDTTGPIIAAVNPIDDTTVDVVFNEAVTSATANTVGNYSINNGLTVSGAVLQGDNLTVRLTTSRQTYLVNYTVTVNNVKDTSNNSIISNSTGTFLGKDNTIPVLASATAVTDTTVDITFNEKVNEATAEAIGNYSINNGMTVSSATLKADGKTVTLTTNVQVKGTTYTVTVGNVQDLAGNTIASASTAQYTGIDTTAPLIVGTEVPNETTVRVIFNEPLDAATAGNVANYSISPSLTVSGAVLQADNQTVELTTSKQTFNIGYTVTVNNVKDPSNNIMAANSTTTFSGDDDTAPSLVNIVMIDNNHLDLVFSELLEASSATIPSNYSLTPSVAVMGATLQMDGKTVRLVTDTLTQDETYILTLNNVRDLAGNSVPANTSEMFIAADVIPPKVVAIKVVSSTSVRLVFSEKLDSSTANVASNYSLSPSLTAMSATLGSDQKTVLLGTSLHTLNTNYTVSVSNVQDLAGNAIGANNTASFIGADATPPVVVAAASASKNTVYVEFDEAMDSSTASSYSNYTINNSVQVLAVKLRKDRKVAILTTSNQVNGTVYTVTVNKVKDAMGNVIAGSNSTSFTGLDITPNSSLIELNVVNPITLELIFSQTLDPVSANNKFNYEISGGLEGLAVDEAVLQPDGKTVRLSTAVMVADEGYELHTSYLRLSTSTLVQEDGATNTVAFSGFNPGYTLDKPEIIGVQGGSESVAVTWNKDSSVTSYSIYRSLEGSIWTLVGSGDGTFATYVDTGLLNYVNYFYKVRASDGTAMAESDIAKAYPPGTSAHGYYGVDTSPCAACHVSHAASSANLLTQPSSVTLCLVCHDGSQSKYDVLSGVVKTDIGYGTSPGGPFGTLQPGVTDTSATAPFNYGGSNVPINQPSSVHNVGQAYVTAPGNLITNTFIVNAPLECISCHNPHNYDNYRMLRGDLGVRFGASENIIRAYAVTDDTGENVNYLRGSVEFCGYCHSDFNQGKGAGSTLAKSTKQTGYVISESSLDKTMHAVNVHKSYGGLTAPNEVDGTTIPYEQDMIICLTCHRAHGTSVAGQSPVRNNKQSTALKRVEYMYLCETCHDKTNNPY